MHRWSFHCDHMCITCFSLSFLETKHTLKHKGSFIEPDPPGFYSNNWRADPTNDRAVTSMGQSIGPSQRLVQSLDTTPSVTSPIGGKQSAYSEERCGRHPYQKYWTHTVYKETILHNSNPSGPQKVTVPPKFIETKLRWKSRETTSNEKNKRNSPKEQIMKMTLPVY